jgi:hypothetical protein
VALLLAGVFGHKTRSYRIDESKCRARLRSLSRRVRPGRHAGVRGLACQLRDGIDGFDRQLLRENARFDEDMEQTFAERQGNLTMEIGRGFDAIFLSHDIFLRQVEQRRYSRAMCKFLVRARWTCARNWESRAVAKLEDNSAPALM